MFLWKKSEEKERVAFFSKINNVLKLKEQFEKQIQILSKIGLLDSSPDGKTLSVTGIDNKKYALPSLEEIYQRMEGKRELIEKKIDQGFTKIILVPFACSLESIEKKYESTLIEHFKSENFYTTKDKISDQNEKLELDLNHALNVWDECKNGDINNTLVYFPKRFDPVYHLGKTKTELLSDSQNAWHIYLMEDMPNLPSLNKGKKIGHRKQIESGKTPLKYLNILQENIYDGEEGLSPEADLIYAITHLEETGQIINDWQGKGNVSYELGAFILSSSCVPWLGWNRDFKRADLWKFGIENEDIHTGLRVGVRI